LFLLVCFATAIIYFYTQANFTSITRGACERANDVRRESNARIYSHVEDEQNLLLLLTAITHTRLVEANAWSDLNNLILKATPKIQRNTKQFKQYERDINDLVIAYKLARTRDANIRARELTVHFDKLKIVDCSKVT
jgi:hypothetical protein